MAKGQNDHGRHEKEQRNNGMKLGRMWNRTSNGEIEMVSMKNWVPCAGDDLLFGFESDCVSNSEKFVLGNHWEFLLHLGLLLVDSSIHKNFVQWHGNVKMMRCWMKTMYLEEVFHEKVRIRHLDTDVLLIRNDRLQISSQCRNVCLRIGRTAHCEDSTSDGLSIWGLMSKDRAYSNDGKTRANLLENLVLMAARRASTSAATNDLSSRWVPQITIGVCRTRAWQDQC